MVRILGLVVIGGALAYGATRFVPTEDSPLTVFTNTAVQSSPSPTAFPFQDMTIPYLRSRSYDSKLAELKTYQDKGTYTSFLTSYTSDGLRVNGLLTKPKGATPEGGWPAIVFVHGYIAPSIYRTTERYDAYIDYLARNGFVVFKIDLRGNGDSEGSPGGAYYSPDYVIDTLSAESALATSDFVNPKKIGFWGHSMAGNVVSRAFSAKPTIPAVAIWAGAGFSYTDLLTYRINDQSYRPPATTSPSTRRRQEMNEKYGTFDPNSEFWKQVPATNYLKDWKGAIELHHAVDDTVVSVEYSRNLVKLLSETSVPHQLFEYPSGGHNITGGSFNTAMSRTVAFYKKYLQ